MKLPSLGKEDVGKQENVLEKVDYIRKDEKQILRSFSDYNIDVIKSKDDMGRTF